MWQRIRNLINGFLSLFIGGIERSSPEALLEVEQENLRKQIAQYNQGLAAHAGLCERLMTQVRRLERDHREVKARTSANLKAGNRDIAAQSALRLQTIDRELEEDRKQMEHAERTYTELVKARDVVISSARNRIESLKNAIGDMKMKRALAEVTEMASGMIHSIGGSGDTIDRLQKMVEEEREKASGRLRVARDGMDTVAVQMKESESKALADQALAEFEAKEPVTQP